MGTTLKRCIVIGQVRAIHIYIPLRWPQEATPPVIFSQLGLCGSRISRGHQGLGRFPEVGQDFLQQSRHLESHRLAGDSWSEWYRMPSRTNFQPFLALACDSWSEPSPYGKVELKFAMKQRHNYVGRCGTNMGTKEPFQHW